MTSHAPNPTQFDHEWHDRALNINVPTLIVAGVIGWGVLILLALAALFIAHLLGAT